MCWCPVCPQHLYSHRHPHSMGCISSAHPPPGWGPTPVSWGLTEAWHTRWVLGESGEGVSRRRSIFHVPSPPPRAVDQGYPVRTDCPPLEATCCSVDMWPGELHPGLPSGDGLPLIRPDLFPIRLTACSPVWGRKTMLSSVKPWALAKVVNFSFTSALEVWARPVAGRRSREGLCSTPPATGAPLGPRLGGTYCRERPCGCPGRGVWSPRCTAGRSPRSLCLSPTRHACCPSLGTQTTLVGRSVGDMPQTSGQAGWERGASVGWLWERPGCSPLGWLPSPSFPPFGQVASPLFSACTTSTSPRVPKAGVLGAANTQASQRRKDFPKREPSLGE